MTGLIETIIILALIAAGTARLIRALHRLDGGPRGGGSARRSWGGM